MHDELAGSLNTALKTKTKDAQTAWQAFESERERLAKSGTDLSNDHTALRKLHDMHEAYTATAKDADDLRERLFRTLGGKASQGIPTGEQRGGIPGLGAEWLKGVGAGVHGTKALDGTTGGSAVPAFFDPRIRDLPQRQLFVRSLIPVQQTDSDMVSYLRQSVATNNAAPVAPGALKPTSIYSVEKREERVRVVAHVSEAIPRQLLSDFSALVDFLDQQLRLGVLLAAENQILNGDATGENFRGILNTTGVGVVTRNVAGNELRSDALYRAITVVRLAFFEPRAVVLHPRDFEDLRLQKDANLNYQTAPIIESDPDRIFGLTVITSPVIAEGTGLVGAFDVGATIWDREQARVTFTEAGLGDAAGQEMFSRNQIRFRGEERLAFGVERPAAFCTVLSL